MSRSLFSRACFPVLIPALALAAGAGGVAPAGKARSPQAASAPAVERSAPAAPAAAASPRRFSIPIGERLHYRADWRLWPAGHASLDLSQAGAFRQISFSALATGVAAILYPVRDEIASIYDPLSFCAVDVVKQTLEGRRKRHTEIHYYPQKGDLVLDERNLNDPQAAPKHVVKPIPGCVLDLFSALYYVRTLPLNLGEVYNFPVNEGGGTVEVRLTPDLKETVVTPAGSFSAIRAEPTVFDSAVFHRKGRMWIWFSDDARHLPLKVEAKVSWGTITAVLTSFAPKSAP